MTYFWVAQCCKSEIYVSRKLADINVGPEEACTCGEKKWERRVPKLDSNRKGYVLEGRGWHDTDYGKYKPNN